MEIALIEKSTGAKKIAIIKLIKKEELPLKKNGWNFNWKTLFKIEGSELFKVSLQDTPNQIEGIVMLTLLNDEMLFMNNIEIAPHNIGNNKKYTNAAGILLAFACKQSFEKGKGNYRGFLPFDSKTELVDLYCKKHGASLAMGHKLFFHPEAGKILMEKHLEISI